MEQVVYDPESGQFLSGSFMDYAMPRADDVCDLAVASRPSAPWGRVLTAVMGFYLACIGYRLVTHPVSGRPPLKRPEGGPPRRRWVWPDHASVGVAADSPPV
jgi:hypothetical protein